MKMEDWWNDTGITWRETCPVATLSNRNFTQAALEFIIISES
jgi:hypothetical protein